MTCILHVGPEKIFCYVETDYLLSSAKNAARLSNAVQDLKAGRSRQHKLTR
jgi:PHD/YefM family antitoxin component YafN of YafNO toxin-antitoxin module